MSKETIFVTGYDCSTKIGLYGKPVKAWERV